MNETKKGKWQDWFKKKSQDIKFVVPAFIVFVMLIFALFAFFTGALTPNSQPINQQSTEKDALLVPRSNVRKPENGFNEIEFRQAVKAGQIKVITAQLDETLNSYILRGRLDEKTLFELPVLKDWYERELARFLQEHNVSIKPLKTIPIISQRPPTKSFWGSIPWILRMAIIFIIIGFIFRLFIWPFIFRGRASPEMAALGKHGKAKIEKYKPGDIKETFNDVAGCEEAKEEIKEIIDMLKCPEEYKKHGSKIPKGVLLVGPPGTGKTLLARVLAGESKTLFITHSGSDFQEMLAGTASARAGDLWNIARKECDEQIKNNQRVGVIIFIDEVESIAKTRSGINFNREEQEQGLNKFLGEMDGFKKNEGIIVVAATNQPNVLDAAFKRKGRFDRIITVDYPNVNGRLAILKIHERKRMERAKSKKLSIDEESLKRVSRITPGFSGADLEATINEAALLASRYKKEGIDNKILDEAIMRVLTGPQYKGKILNKNERERTAWHESGHTLVGYFLPNAIKPQKVSLVATANMLGFTWLVPEEDRHLWTESQIKDHIASCLGGYAVEKWKFQEISSGVHNDLEQVTKWATFYVCKFGMSEKLGALSLGRSYTDYLGEGWQLLPDISNETKQTIHEERKKLIDECLAKTTNVIQQNQNKLKKLVDALLEKEVLEKEDIEAILTSQ